MSLVVLILNEYPCNESSNNWKIFVAAISILNELKKVVELLCKIELVLSAKFYKLQDLSYIWICINSLA